MMLIFSKHFIDYVGKPVTGTAHPRPVGPWYASNDWIAQVVHVFSEKDIFQCVQWEIALSIKLNFILKAI